MKVWNATISGHEGTKYHKMILLKDIKRLKKEMNNEKLLEKIEMIITLHAQNPKIETAETLKRISDLLETRYLETRHSHSSAKEKMK